MDEKNGVGMALFADKGTKKVEKTVDIAKVYLGSADGLMLDLLQYTLEISQEFDLGNKIKAETITDEFLDMFNKGEVIGGSGVAAVDDKITMFFGNLGIADGKTLEV